MRRQETHTGVHEARRLPLRVRWRLWRIRREAVRYGVKAIPCIVVWIALQLELFGARRHEGRIEAMQPDGAQPLAHEG